LVSDDGPTNRLATVTYPNGQTSAYSYLPASQERRLQTIHHKYPNATTLSKFDYAYDAVGNILTWQQQADSAARTTWRYGYDRADQLLSAIQETTDPTPTILHEYAYGFDPAGNRLYEQIDADVTAWTYTNLNRLQAQAGGGVLQNSGHGERAGDGDDPGGAGRGVCGERLSGRAAGGAGDERVHGDGDGREWERGDGAVRGGRHECAEDIYV
jgi:hypothetical protein